MKTKRFYYVLVSCLIGLTANGQETKTIDFSTVLIPAGEFLMGKDSDKDYNFNPAHKVKVDSFYMDKHETTNGEYFRFCKETGHRLPEFWNTDIFRSGEDYLNYPVIGINWWDVKKYAEWAGKRLPTEAEWEYAARGGCHTPYYKYPWCDNTINCTKANFYNGATCNPLGLSSYPHTAPVGYYSANNFGLYDMAGNVRERCNDWYGSDYYSTSPYDNPTGPESGDRRIIRGGGWTVPANYCRIATRSWSYPSGRGYVHGFRIVLDLE